MSGPTPGELWKQAGGGTPRYSQERYVALLREHGHLVPLEPGEKREPLPCGWPDNRAAASSTPTGDTETVTDEAIAAAKRRNLDGAPGAFYVAGYTDALADRRQPVSDDEQIAADLEGFSWCVWPLGKEKQVGFYFRDSRDVNAYVTLPARDALCLDAALGGLPDPRAKLDHWKARALAAEAVVEAAKAWRAEHGVPDLDMDRQLATHNALSAAVDALNRGNIDALPITNEKENQ